MSRGGDFRDIRVAIGRLPFQPDLLALDQGRVSGRRFGREAGITNWRLQSEILHRLPLAADLEGEARAIENFDDSGLEQIRRRGRRCFAQGQRGPEIDRGLTHEEGQIIAASGWQQVEQKCLDGFVRCDGNGILIAPRRIEPGQGGDDIGAGV